MQDLKVYIVIEDPKTRQDLSIKGNFEILRVFLSGVGPLEIQTTSMSTTSQTLEKKELATAQKRLSRAQVSKG